MLQRSLFTALLLTFALVPGAGAAPRAHSSAEVRAEAALEGVEDLSAGKGVRTGRELTLALHELSTRVKHLSGDERERAVSLLSRPTDQDAPDDERFTLPEQLPLCRDDFCVHFMLPDAGIAALVLTEANLVSDFENDTLGWNRPPNDNGIGGDNRVDIYLKELGSQKLFGFAATDPNQNTLRQHSYLVIDNDFDPNQYGGAPALESLRVTLAHEYAHVLQYGYDVTADGWHYESSAVWMEQRMYPEIKDWLRFVTDRQTGAGWSSLTELPLTAFEHPDDQPRNAKPYGDVVWNYFLSSKYGSSGDALQLGSWEHSNGVDAPSTAAFNSAIRDAGGTSMSSDFAAFSAAVPEWRVPQSVFPDASSLPDVERVGSLVTDGAAVSPLMDHLTFAFYDVPATTAGQIRLAGVLPAGTSGALALVARKGTADGGTVTTRFVEMPNGGAGGVTLDQPASFFDSGGRITAVLVNSSTTHGNYDNGANDWRWSRDNQSFTARVTTNTSGPSVSARTPGPGATRVSTRSPITVTFSEAVVGVDDTTFVLRDTRGRKVPTAVTYVNATQTATLIPTRELADTTRYTVRVGGSILNATAVPIAQTDWTFTTVRRKPRASLSLRGGSFRLRSRDNDRLTWAATLKQGGRTVGRRSGRLRAGATRDFLISGGRAGNARVVVVLTDPQGNKKRLTRAITLL